MTGRIEIVGGAGPWHAAAIVAAIARLEEEQAAAAAVPQGRPGRGQWVLSAIPRTMTPPHAGRPAPLSEGWSVGTPVDSE